MADYARLPEAAKVKPTPFTAHVSDEKLKNMIELVKLSPIGVESYENKDTSRDWGMNRDWLIKAQEYWATKFDWRAHEKRINSFPNYTVPITDDDGAKYDMHFIALFSEKKDAVPIGLFHGWPGSFLEFLDLLDHVKQKYPAAQLPYHIIVPSLPGYTYSSGPPTTTDASRITMSRLCQKLMHQLGFGDGYVAQGGDLGSFVAKWCADHDPACKAYHQNMIMLRELPKNSQDLKVNEIETKGLAKAKKWFEFGTAYGQEHGTRSGTIGLALSASPIAMLAWIGEKFLEWTDVDPPLEQILESVSLYWLTDTFPKCVYPYRTSYGYSRKELEAAARPEQPNTKPMGYSYFPFELAPTPISWAGTTGNMVWSKQHQSGGHFAAMEKPGELLADVEEFVKVAWK